MGFFEQDTALTPLSEQRWQGELKQGWRIGSVPNGGYVLSVIARALQQALPHNDPLSINAFYMAPCALGPCEIVIEPLQEGRGTSFATASLYQNQELKVRATAAYTDLEQLSGETWVNSEMPEAPPFESLADQRANLLEIHQRVDSRLVKGAEVFTRGEKTGTGEFVAWLQHIDAAPIGSIDLCMFADIMPPPPFTLFGPYGWVPTIELTVQCRALPVTGPLLGRMRSRHLTRGIIESDCDLWDSAGNVVALARQTMKVRLPK
jgi:hypothetical protein